MQPTLAPVVPSPTTNPYAESHPSPRAPSTHAFANLLRQRQTPVPVPVKAAATPARADAVDGAPQGAEETRPASATKARREDDDKGAGAATRSKRAEAPGKSTGAADTGEKSEGARKSDDEPPVDGAGSPPLTHGLLAPHRAAAPEPGNASSGSRVPTTTSMDPRVGEVDDAGRDGRSTVASSNGSERGAADAARRLDVATAGTSVGSGEPAAAKADEAVTAGRDTASAPITTPINTVETPLPSAAAPTTPATVAAAPVEVTVPTPVNSPDFTQALAVQVSVLVQDGVQRAELHLNPSDMGPISVQVVVEGTQARVEFGADAAETRRAIEAGLPELASALRDAGMTLQGGGVSQHARDPGASANARPDTGWPRRDSPPEYEALAAPTASQRMVAAGGIDLYA